jgi:hypothetical protein
MTANCADCGMEYGTFPDMILPDDVWARIAPREGKYGILCPTCIAKRLDKIGLWYQDGYYNHKGWSAFNPLAEQVESLQADNARLQAELTSLRSENAMLRKMQPVTLNGDAARSFALAAELSATKQQLAHMTGAYDTQARVHDKLNRDYIAVRDELSGLRADIETGRLVRVPCREVFSEAGNVVYLIYEGEAVEVVHCGATLDADGKVFVRLAAEDKIFQCRQPDPEHDTDPTDWCSNVIDILADNYSKDVFPTEQAARAAMDGDTE